MVTERRRRCDISRQCYLQLDPAEAYRVITPDESYREHSRSIFEHSLEETTPVTMVTTPSAKNDRSNGHDTREIIVLNRESSRPERLVSPSPLKPSLLDHPIGQHALTALRDQHTSGKLLKYYSHLLLVLLTTEATRNLPIREIAIDSYAGSFHGKSISKPVVFLSLSRHGLGMSHEAAEFIPAASIGSVSLDYDVNGRLEPRLHLANAPALHEARVILFDPVIGAGLSAGIALNLLRKCGAVDLTLISFILSGPGLKRVQETLADVTIWTAAIDSEYDPKRGPLPGIGNFAQRLYGTRGVETK